ncbi:MAG TPA: universal stress protein [Candidatus Sulfotelmatobacter sp.]|nr:universal stress protein [Candidatus Sulfotelmatobacter sp.]
MPTLQVASRIALKNILLTTDFSETSSVAQPFAASLARTYGAELFVAHVLAPEPRLAVPTDRIPEEDDLHRETAQGKLLDFVHKYVNTPCKTLLRQGDLGLVIAELVDENAIDLLVLGTHGRRGVPRLVLGSAAETIYRAAQCPVLTISPKVPLDGAKPWSIQRVLFPVDFTGDIDNALHFALSFAEENQARLILMHAAPMVPWQYRPDVEERLKARLEGLIPAEAKDWCRLETLVNWDFPDEGILRVAEEREADLIVMGVHRGRVGLTSHLPWPIASGVVSRAPCPVLTVRV